MNKTITDFKHTEVMEMKKEKKVSATIEIVAQLSMMAILVAAVAII